MTYGKPIKKKSDNKTSKPKPTSKTKKKDKFHKKGVPLPIPKGINKEIDMLLDSSTFKASEGGRVGNTYKVDNSGQQMVAKQYGGKING